MLAKGAPQASIRAALRRAACAAQSLEALRLAMRIGRRSGPRVPASPIYLAEAGLSRRALPRSTRASSRAFRHQLGDRGDARGDPRRARYSFTVHGPEEFDRRALQRSAEKMRRAAFTVAGAAAAASFAAGPTRSTGRGSMWSIAASGERFPAAQPLPAAARGWSRSGASSSRRAAPACQAFAAAIARHPELHRRWSAMANCGAAPSGRARSGVTGSSGISRSPAGSTRCGSAPSSPPRMRSSCQALPRGLPMVVMEAMASGPVISTYIAGIPGWFGPAKPDGSSRPAMPTLAAAIGDFCRDAPCAARGDGRGRTNSGPAPTRYRRVRRRARRPVRGRTGGRADRSTPARPRPGAAGAGPRAS